MALAASIIPKNRPIIIITGQAVRIKEMTVTKIVSGHHLLEGIDTSGNDFKVLVKDCVTSTRSSGREVIEFMPVDVISKDVV